MMTASSSSWLRARSLCAAQSGCRARSRPARICSSPCASAGSAPEQPRGHEHTASSSCKLLQFHHPWQRGHGLQGPFSSLQSGHCPCCPQSSCGHPCPAAGICSAPAPCQGLPCPAPAPAKRAMHSSCPSLLKGPHSVGSPQHIGEGTFQSLPKALLEGCQGQRAKGAQMGWTRLGCLDRQQHCACQQCCRVAGAKGQMLRCYKGIHCSSGALTLLPRVTFVLPGKPLGPTEATSLLLAACWGQEEGPCGGASEEEALSPVFRSEHLEKK